MSPSRLSERSVMSKPSLFLRTGIVAMMFASVPAMAGEKVLYSFKSGMDGDLPLAGVIEDANGNLYGTTQNGAGAGCGGAGCGTVFKLAPDGTETVLHAFQGGADGAQPQAGLIADQAGNLYGTTTAGGSGTDNAGTVFEIAPGGGETILYSFCGQANCADGAGPIAGLILDGEGNLYGTTTRGGSTACEGGCGVVFKLAPGGVQTVLYAFKGGKDGEAPEAGVVMDGAGDLVGATLEGGGNSAYCKRIFPSGCGTVFRIAPDGSEKILYRFCSQATCADGAAPELAGLVMDDKGDVYGTAAYGGEYGHGVVFRLTPSGKESVLHAFQGPPTDGHETVLTSFEPAADGVFPYGGVIVGSAGDLIGTTGYGGAHGSGTVFALRGK
jgi:uncharacterized repeat protein (TIGR03803 family)